MTSDQILELLTGLHAPDNQAREKTVVRLKAMDKSQSFSVLISLLSHQDGNVRCDAATAMQLIDERQGVDAILSLMIDKSHYVRWHICGLMHDFGDERAIEPLIERIKTDSDPQVRGTAAYALGGVGNPKAISALQETARDDHEVDKHVGLSLRRADRRAPVGEPVQLAGNL
ncbi:MAG: HEAT repeat domain-containing protein [Chloroflexi bacterium]|nr:HEAT repeat domain-containing protein [Chloroflexota bacterium]